MGGGEGLDLLVVWMREWWGWGEVVVVVVEGRWAELGVDLVS